MSAKISNKAKTHLASRYIATFLIKFVSDFLVFTVKKYDLSLQEIGILSFVLSESFRDLLNDPFAIRNFGTEEGAVPESFLTPVNLKSIHLNLGLSRETARRKLENLVAQGYLIRSRHGYAFPAKTGPSDRNSAFRAFMVHKLDELQKFASKIPE